MRMQSKETKLVFGFWEWMEFYLKRIFFFLLLFLLWNIFRQQFTTMKRDKLFVLFMFGCLGWWIYFRRKVGLCISRPRSIHRKKKYIELRSMDGNNVRHIIIISIAIYIINSIKAFSLSVVSFLSHFLSSVRHPQLMHRANPTTPPHPIEINILRMQKNYHSASEHNKIPSCSTSCESCENVFRQHSLWAWIKFAQFQWILYTLG